MDLDLFLEQAWLARFSLLSGLQVTLGTSLLSILLATLALRPATTRRTWGYRRAEVLGATLQAAVLLAVGGYIAVEAIVRLCGVRLELFY